MHICLTCKESFNGMTDCEAHAEEHAVQPKFELEFGWVVLIPGGGHIEINFVRTFVEFTWDVFYKRLAITMNFKSEVALSYCRKVSDHHKAWTLIRIARDALTREMLVPFVRAEMKKESQNYSVANFEKFMMLTKDPNYGFMMDLLFDILDSIFMLRVGFRCGYPDFITAALNIFGKMFCARNHPLYREVEVALSTTIMRMPPEVRTLVFQTMSLNMSGSSNTGQAADFRLEELNKIIQSWLPSVPSPSDWKAACRNLDKLVQIRERMFNEMGIKDPKGSGSSFVQDISAEVRAFRGEIRKAKYFDEPHTSKAHTSLDGELLNPQLIGFSAQARKNRSVYIDNFVEHEKVAHLSKAAPPKYNRPPIFVTQQDSVAHESTENKTIHEIKNLIEHTINTLCDEEAKQAWQEEFQTAIVRKKPRKADIIEFYNSVKEFAALDALEGLHDIMSD